MNKVSLALNAVLLLAVAVLFYLHFSLSSRLGGGVEESKNEETKGAPKLVTDPSKLANAKIAYVNLDSLNFKYDYITEKSKDIQGRIANLQAQYSSMRAKFEEDVANFQQAVQAGIRPEAELQAEEARLQQKQYEIANKEKQMQNLSDEVADSQMDMLKKVSQFIANLSSGKYDYVLAYTSNNISSVLYANPDLEITNEVVNGLNEEYAKSKTTPKNK